MDQHLYSTTALNAVVQSLIKPSSFLLDLFFPTVKTFETESVFIDIEHARRRVAAFCSPLVEGKPVSELGWESIEFTPAYTKEKSGLKPQRAFKRAAGETYGGGQLSPIQRQALRIAATLTDHTDAILRRKELMAVEALVKGTVTVSGPGYATKVVDFRRSRRLTFVNIGNEKWDGSDADPLADIQHWLSETKRVEGAVITILVMDIDAWEACWKSENFRKALNVLHLGINSEMNPTAGALNVGPSVTADGVDYKGKIGSVGIYVYDEVYEDPATGETVPFLASGTVLGGTPQIEGEQLHGAIQDDEAGLKPWMFFVKSKPEFDPAGYTILTQSSPLVVPKRPNASFSARVL